MILPRLNAFIVAVAPNGLDLVWGRVTSMNVMPKQCTLTVPVSHDGEIDTLEFPPWKLVHCHHQPVAEYVKIDGKRTFCEGADDSFPWRLTREAVARAMTDFSKFEGELL